MPDWEEYLKSHKTKRDAKSDKSAATQSQESLATLPTYYTRDPGGDEVKFFPVLDLDRTVYDSTSRVDLDSYLDAVQQIIVMTASSNDTADGKSGLTAQKAKDITFTLDGSSETRALADVLPLLITDAEVSTDLLHAFNVHTCLAAPWPGVARTQRSVAQELFRHIASFDVKNPDEQFVMLAHPSERDMTRIGVNAVRSLANAASQWVPLYNASREALSKLHLPGEHVPQLSQFAHDSTFSETFHTLRSRLRTIRTTLNELQHLGDDQLGLPVIELLTDYSLRVSNRPRALFHASANKGLTRRGYLRMCEETEGCDLWGSEPRPLEGDTPKTYAAGNISLRNLATLLLPDKLARKLNSHDQGGSSGSS